MGETDWGKLGLLLMGRAMLSKSLIQFSVDGQSCVPSLLFDLTRKKGSVHTLPHSISPILQQATANPCLCHRLLDPHRQVWVSLLRDHCSFLLGSWCTQGFVCALQEPVSPVLWKFCSQIPLASKVKFSGSSQSLCQIPRLGNLL